jgi:hypothetical protein
MLLPVSLSRTGVSEEGSAFFIRVARIGELGTTQGELAAQRVADCDTDHYLLVAKIRERLPVDK